ncbi:MAG: hypothetical protein ABH969_00310 [Pseudomonadota bacterium]
MPQTCQILPVTRVEVIREALGYFSGFIQTILNPLKYPLNSVNRVNPGKGYYGSMVSDEKG